MLLFFCKAKIQTNNGEMSYLKPSRFETVEMITRLKRSGIESAPDNLCFMYLNLSHIPYSSIHFIHIPVAERHHIASQPSQPRFHTTALRIKPKGAMYHVGRCMYEIIHVSKILLPLTYCS